ncbi:MAG TPA: hypothetical protein VNO51_22560 [Ilumatobacteraceae bacterium]|nr:hypothetical protein [Ilumatobacteraceae bacterium]
MTRTRHPNITRARRALGALVAVAAASGVAIGNGGSADAATMTVFLHPIQIMSGGICTARVGVDIAMSQADAQTFIDHPGEEVTAKMWADDPIWDNALIALPTDAPAWPQTWAGGLSVEFVRTFSCHILDEDWRDDEDEIFAKVTFNDFRVGRTQTANSNKIVKDFSTVR